MVGAVARALLFENPPHKSLFAAGCFVAPLAKQTFALLNGSFGHSNWCGIHLHLAAKHNQYQTNYLFHATDRLSFRLLIRRL